MEKKYNSWKSLFLFCLGLFLASAFCMKWLEPSFIHNGKLFTIIGLELTYSKEQIIAILSGIDPHVKSLLRYHLIFDFVFMTGVYPGIMALNRMAATKTRNTKIKKMLLIVSLLQLVAWACDIVENKYLLKWIDDPTTVSNLAFYHFIVTAKWAIALAGIFTALLYIFRKRDALLKS